MSEAPEAQFSDTPQPETLPTPGPDHPDNAPDAVPEHDDADVDGDPIPEDDPDDVALPDVELDTSDPETEPAS